MVLLGTVCEPHIIHLMQGPLKVPSLVQAVVGYPGVEVEAGPLVAAEGSVVVIVDFSGCMRHRLRDRFGDWTALLSIRIPKHRISRRLTAAKADSRCSQIDLIQSKGGNEHAKKRWDGSSIGWRPWKGQRCWNGWTSQGKNGWLQSRCRPWRRMHVYKMRNDCSS